MNDTRRQILQALEQASGRLVSGGELAEKLGLSRTAVWKQISALQQEGYHIRSESGKGYRLERSEVFSSYEVEKRLETRVIGRPLIYLPTVDSTNIKLKQLAAEGAGHGTVIFSSHQTAGRGRLSRRFESPDGQGVYLSILLRPDIPLSELNTVTLMTAVVMLDTIEELTGVRPGIKWTNDIYLNGRKLCGILTECSVEGESGRVEYAVVGIGLNLYQQREDFPEEIRQIAGSVLSETGLRINRADYIACLLKHFEAYFVDGAFPANKAAILEKYRAAIFFLGKRVQVCGFSESYPATAVDIDGEGRLVVEREDGSRTALNSGVISIRFAPDGEVEG